MPQDFWIKKEKEVSNTVMTQMRTRIEIYSEEGCIDLIEYFMFVNL